MTFYELDPHYCVEQLVRYQDGTVSGDTIFVNTDCSDRTPLPPERQDPAYNHPGVPIPRNELARILGAMEIRKDSLNQSKDTGAVPIGTA